MEVVKGEARRENNGEGKKTNEGERVAVDVAEELRRQASRQW
jgi:hypothetical protein